nr:hypothetical protein QOL21_05260 [Acholeplasma laidlawii]
MLIEDKIIEIAKKVFQVDEIDVKIDSRFKGGMSNYTYLVYIKELPYVIRIIGDGGEALVKPSIEKSIFSTQNF